MGAFFECPEKWFNACLPETVETRVEHVSLCVGRSETVDYARYEFPKKSLQDGAAAPSMGKVEAAVRGLQGGKEDMVASWRGELFPCRKIYL